MELPLQCLQMRKIFYSFYQCVSLLLTWMQAVHYDKSKLSFCLVVVFFVIFGVIVLTDLFLEEDGRQTGRTAWPQLPPKKSI
jgi:hypothetical protein